MREELIVMLGEYLQGKITLGECYGWIAGVSWDDELDNNLDLKTALGRLELLSIEFLEGLRPESEFEFAARESIDILLSNIVLHLYVPYITTEATSSSTAREEVIKALVA